METQDTDLLVTEPDEKLLQMASEADAETSPGQPTVAQEPEVRAPGEETEQTAPVETDKGQKPPVSSETEPETPEQKAERERDEKGRFKAKEQLPIGEQKPVAGIKETDYSRAQKEQARKERSWQQIETEKAEVRAEKARIDEERRFSQLQQQGQPLPPVLKDGYSAQDYWGAYQDFKRNGDHENAAKALEAVREIETFTAQAVQQQQAAAIELAFTADRDRIFEKQPDLTDPQKPISQEVMKVLNEFPEVYFMPKGFERAVQLAQLRMDAGSVSELRDENVKLRAELERRDKQSQPAKGGPTAPATERPFESLSLDEQEARLLQRAELADSFAGVG